MQPSKRRRRFHIIMAAVLAAIIVGAIAIVVDIQYSYVNVEVEGSPDASFILRYDSTNITLPASQNATVAVLPHANVTIIAITNSSYAVSGWSVTGANYRTEANGTINFLTGSGGSAILVSVKLSKVTGRVG